jgi:hypothetical protein
MAKIDETPQAKAAIRRNLEEERDRLSEQYAQAGVAKTEALATVDGRVRELRASAEAQEAQIVAEHEANLAHLRAQTDAQEASIRSAAERLVTSADAAKAELSEAFDRVVGEIEKLPS